MTPRELFLGDDLTWLERPDAEVETASVERKRWADKREVARQLSAFANGSVEGGLLVLGADKDGTIPGIDDRLPQGVSSLLAELPSAIESCGHEARQVKTPNGRTVLLFWVPYSHHRVICTAGGHAWQRRGNTTVELKAAEIQELRFARGEESFEDLAAAEWKLELIDQQLLDSYLEARRRRNGLTMELSVEDALRTKRLLVETSRGLMLTKAGVLALARNPLDSIPGARLRFLRFEGTTEKFGTERNVTKDRWFEGPIPLLVASAREFIRTLVREFDYLGPTGLFVTEPEYPEPAWDEAIVNALVHRSYSLSNTPVFVRMFDDRMEIESPGGFPGPAREQRSYPRNPRLMDALQYFELVRLAREGTRRMIAEMQKLGLPPPEFSEPGGASVLVVLRNDLERRRKRQGVEDAREKWSEVARLIEEPLALYRRKGLEQWAQLVQSGSRPPEAVLTSAAGVLMNSSIAEEQRMPLIEALRHSGADLPKREVDALVGAFTQGSFAATPKLEARIASLLRESPNARAQLLQWLEQCPPATHEPEGVPTKQIGHALWVLRTELESAGAPPPREHIDRVLAVARKHVAAPGARELYEEITGSPLK